MRQVMDAQMKFGEVDISEITFKTRSTDEMVKVLKGLQHIYMNKETRTKLFDYLERLSPEDTRTDTGRPGMNMWKVFVLAMVRLAKNSDINGLLDLADNHMRMRAMMGHTRDDDTTYDEETIRRNMQLFTPEIIDEINKIIVDAGHKIVVKKNSKMNMRHWWSSKQR